MTSPATSTSPATGRAPVLLVVPAALAVALLAVPLAGLVVRAPWRQLPELLAEPELRQALWLSVLTATVATMVAIALGVLAGSIVSTKMQRPAL